MSNNPRFNRLKYTGFCPAKRFIVEITVSHKVPRDYIADKLLTKCNMQQNGFNSIFRPSSYTLGWAYASLVKSIYKSVASLKRSEHVIKVYCCYNLEVVKHMFGLVSCRKVYKRRHYCVSACLDICKVPLPFTIEFISASEQSTSRQRKQHTSMFYGHFFVCILDTHTHTHQTK